EVVELVPKQELDRAQRQIERLQKENERRKRESERLKQESERLRQEIERLRKELEAALRAGKRQAAPHSRGELKANPQPPGPKAQSPRSSHQRDLRVPAGPRCPATPMRRARAVNKYGSNSQVIRGLVAQRVLGGPSRYQQGHSKLVPAGDVHRFSGQYVGVNALARHLRVIDHWLRQHLKKSGTAMLAVPVNSRATTYFLRKEVAAELRISPPRKSWR